MIFSNGKALRAEPDFYVRNVIVKENTPQWTIENDEVLTWKEKESYYLDTHLMYRDEFITCLSRTSVDHSEVKELKKALSSLTVSKALEDKTTPSLIQCYLYLAIHNMKKGLRKLSK